LAVLDSQAATLSVRTAKVTWAEALRNRQCVVHLAARVHVMHDASSDPLAEFRKANVESTLALATQAAQSGVQRFVFISSVKVNGEHTQTGHPFRSDDQPAPQDPYGISKMEAEVGLRAIARQTGMEVVIIRPPLVYGPGVKANFASMVRWLQRGMPLPLGAIDNRRSLVALDNLVDLIVTCLDHPAAANQTFMVSDGDDVSTTELLQRMGAALGKPARLLPVPQGLLEWGAALLGKKDVAQRLFSSLQVDAEPTRQLLGWKPPVSLDQGLLQVAKHVQNL
jgi:nucleoside-diphosphate-sugar epimerase